MSRSALLAGLSLFLSLVTSAQVPLPQSVTMFDGTWMNQSVTVSVDTINELSVSGNVTLTISTATAGSAPDEDTDAASTYAVTVNGTGKKITGSLDADYTTGITLELLLAAPTGGTAVEKTLSTAAQDLVTGFGKVAESGLTVTYTASAAVTVASNGAGQARTVTLTLADM
ncbi:MAG: hypothetical protein HKN29_06510 [Rhodothermales bacterium]|nr:hypothetical protein [Rhodothermales bacterium]